MQAWQRISFLICAAGLAGAQTQPVSVPAVETILARMVQARAENRAQLRSFSVTRDYRLYNKEKQKPKAEVTAHVTFVPPDVKRFAIQRAKGMGLGSRIVREILENESESVKNYLATDVSSANYDLRFLGQEDLNGRPCYVLEMLPKRKEKNLIKGKMWVDTTTFMLHRAEGQPAKGLSFWLKDVKIALIYGDVGGMWLQTGSESTANVRLFGQYTIVSQDMEYKISELTAAAGQAGQ